MLNPNDEETMDVIAMRINDQIQYYDSLETDDKALERMEAQEEFETDPGGFPTDS